MKSKHNIDELVSNYRPPSTKSKEEAWKELKAGMQNEQPKRIVKKWMFAAASVLVAAVLFAVFADSFIFVEKYSTAFGEQETVLLRDDSEVVLASNSVLKVNYSFLNGKRKLALSGQALFQVEPGKQFSVKFNRGKVTVLGTRFTVKAYENLPSEIKCLSGNVKVESGKEKSLLEKGEGVIVEKKAELQLVNVEEEEALEEMNGVFSWQNEPLNSVFKILEARLGYTIKASQKVKNRKFSGEINMNEIQSASEILVFAMDLNYSIDHQNHIVTFEDKE